MNIISVVIIGDTTASHFDSGKTYQIESVNVNGFTVKVDQARKKIVPKTKTRCGAVILPNGKIHLI